MPKKRSRAEFNKEMVPIFELPVEILEPIKEKAPVKKIKREVSSKATSEYNQKVDFQEIATIKKLKFKMDQLHLNTEQRQITLADFERQQFKKEHDKWIKFY
jgi:hypothetical protein